uniref:Integrase catalytic domain-containing protein n=1 Tax=Cannabis sativa TaxID=3483 RepID=A0A803QDX1_CANSA
MVAYVLGVRELLQEFKNYKIEQIPQERNVHVDCLAKLASDSELENLGVVPVEYLTEPSIRRKAEVATNERMPRWMDQIVKYITKGEMPQKRTMSIRVQYQAHRYLIIDGILYPRGLKIPYLRASPNEITLITSPWPFAVWGIDLIGSLPKGKGGIKYAIVDVDYFTIWIEAEPMKSITAKKSLDFVVKNIVRRYGLLHKIVLDNGKQFDCDEFMDFCNKHRVIKSFSIVARPQANGEAEAVNKILKVTLKKKLWHANTIGLKSCQAYYGHTGPLKELPLDIPHSQWCMGVRPWSQ